MDDDLIYLLEQALLYPTKRHHLLQQEGMLRTILNDLTARRWLYEQAVLEPLNDHDRKVRSRQVRQLIIQIMQHSGCISQPKGIADPQVYDDAIARTWEWFSCNFQRYNPELSSFVTWFNIRLQWTIREIFREEKTYRERHEQPFSSDDAINDPIEQIPDITFKFNSHHQILEEWIMLVQHDPEKEMRNCRMQNHPHVNGQKLVLAILNHLLVIMPIDWDQLSQELNVGRTALYRFWQNTCRSKFRQLLLKYYFCP